MMPPPTLANLMLDGREPFAYPPPLAVGVRRVLAGSYDYPVIPDSVPARRVIDVGSGVADFACWVYKRTGAFVDCYEALPQAAELCKHNGPPGVAVHNVAVTTSATPKGENPARCGQPTARLHVGADWDGSSLDPAMPGRSGEIIEVPALHPFDLPRADVIKVATEGSEIDILRAYMHLKSAQVVMFQWCREKDRPVLEQLCAEAGLRLFKAAHESVSRGLQVWIRSRAIVGAGRYVMPMTG